MLCVVFDAVCFLVACCLFTKRLFTKLYWNQEELHESVFCAVLGGSVR